VRGNDKVEAKRRKVLKLGTASSTAFEIRTSKGEVKDKETEKSLNQREKGKVLLTLSRLLN